MTVVSKQFGRITIKIKCSENEKSVYNYVLQGFIASVLLKSTKQVGNNAIIQIANSKAFVVQKSQLYRFICKQLKLKNIEQLKKRLQTHNTYKNFIFSPT